MNKTCPPCNHEKMKDISGQRFGRLLVTSCTGEKKNRAYTWNVVCDCGTAFIALGGPLRDGRTKSCGCLQREKARSAGDRTRTHGMTNTPIYAIWDSMHQRCSNPKTKSFPRYGGRGIKVCAEWKSFEVFLVDMGLPPAGMTLDRINNDMGYSKENCRWATVAQQNRNRSVNRLIEFNGETKCLSVWAEELGINPITLHSRLNKSGWTVERALTTPIDARFSHA